MECDNAAQSGLDRGWKVEALQTVSRHQLAAPDDFGSAAGAKRKDSAARLDGMGRLLILAAMLAGMDCVFVFNVVR
jgi:hypothetical protein